MAQVDPMVDKYSSLTSYNFAFNNPVSFNDPNGADPENGVDGGRASWVRGYLERIDGGGGGGISNEYVSLGSEYGRMAADARNIRNGSMSEADFVQKYGIALRIVGAEQVELYRSFWNGENQFGVNIHYGTELELAEMNARMASRAEAVKERLRSKMAWMDNVPILGSIKKMDAAIQEGRYMDAAGNFVLAVSDMYLVRSVIKGIGQGGLTALTKGNLPWNSAPWKDSYRKFFLNSGFISRTERGHHWLIQQNGLVGKYVPNFIKNQMFNIKVFADQATHMTLGHGKNYGEMVGAGILGRLWFGTPSWSKAAIISTTGRISD